VKTGQNTNLDRRDSSPQKKSENKTPKYNKSLVKLFIGISFLIGMGFIISA